nr:hypothetical protein CFP56_76160 [Quercus suber]
MRPTVKTPPDPMEFTNVNLTPPSSRCHAQQHRCNCLNALDESPEVVLLINHAIVRAAAAVALIIMTDVSMSDSSDLSSLDTLSDDEKHPPPAQSVLDRLAQLRRPVTTNPSDFWYRSAKVWAASMRTATHRRDREGKAAVLSLERYDGAGGMIETSEGRVAERACQRCVGTYEPRMVYVDW